MVSIIKTIFVGIWLKYLSIYLKVLACIIPGYSIIEQNEGVYDDFPFGLQTPCAKGIKMEVKRLEGEATKTSSGSSSPLTDLSPQ